MADREANWANKQNQLSASRLSNPGSSMAPEFNMTGGTQNGVNIMPAPDGMMGGGGVPPPAGPPSGPDNVLGGVSSEQDWNNYKADAYKAHV